MYSETDIDAAVASGALTPAAAQALRDSVAGGRAAPAVDEESFRLLTGFNDIFVSIAAVLLLVAVGWIGSLAGQATMPHGADVGRSMTGFPSGGLLGGGALVAAVAWGLAEYFTRRRRMALPSIILLAAFVYGVAAALFGLFSLMVPLDGPLTRAFSAMAGLASLLSAGAALLHWRRFHVPITIAALTGALVGAVLAAVVAVLPAAVRLLPWFTLLAGLCVFAFAMWWDTSDRARLTRRSDVAFWLHLSAAPLIAHPLFNLLGVLGGQPDAARAVGVLLLYAVFGVVALAVDRRALLVSGLLYVLYALNQLFAQAGAVGVNVALTALVIGSGLLLLSAFWASARRALVRRLPADLQARLPVIDRPVAVRG